MSDRKPDPSLPIPNDDPRCLCELGTEGPVTGGTCAIAGTVCGSPVNLLLRDDCVHHGPAIALVLKSIGSQVQRRRPLPASGAQGWPVSSVVREHCLPGCDRHDGRDAGACMRDGTVLVPPMPACSCHGMPVGHVHPDNYRPEVGGRNRERGWIWHCPAEDCSGYPVTLLVLEEWAAASPPLAPFDVDAGRCTDCGNLEDGPFARWLREAAAALEGGRREWIETLRQRYGLVTIDGGMPREPCGMTADGYYEGWYWSREGWHLGGSEHGPTVWRRRPEWPALPPDYAGADLIAQMSWPEPKLEYLSSGYMHGAPLYECDCCERRNVPAKSKAIGYLCGDCLGSWTWDYGRLPAEQEPPDHHAGRTCPYRVTP